MALLGAEMWELLLTVGRIVVLVSAFLFSSLWLSKWMLKSKKMQHGFQLPPGPRPLPIIGNLAALGPLPHQSLAKLAKTYGPLMYLRLGSVPAVIVSSAEMAEEILKTHDKVFASRPRVTSCEILGYGSQNFAFLPYGDHWRNARKLFTTQLVTAKRIEETQRMRKEEILLMLRSVVEESEAVEGSKAGVPMFNQFFAMATNIVARLMFSKRMFGSSDLVAFRGSDFQETVEEVFRLFGVVNIGDFVPFLKPFDLQGCEKQMRATHKKLDVFLQHLLDVRSEDIRLANHDNDEAEDFMTKLLTRPTETTGQPMTADQIKGMFVDVLLAGTDTSSMTLEWALSELLKNPAVLRKCVEELDTVVGRSRLVEESDIPSLPYLHAVVKETFRLHPPGALLLPHESTADCKVGEYFVPAQSRVMVNVWAVGRDPAVWYRAQDFHPERFLPNQVDADVDLHGRDFKLLPFGSGRRGCPGKNFALQVVQQTLAVMLQSCQWSLPGSAKPEDLDMSENFRLGVSKAVKLMAIATPRLPSSVIFGSAEDQSF